MPYTELNFNILGHKSDPNRHGAAAGKQNLLGEIPDPAELHAGLPGIGRHNRLDFVAPSRLAQATSHSTRRGDLP